MSDAHDVPEWPPEGVAPPEPAPASAPPSAADEPFAEPPGPAPAEPESPFETPPTAAFPPISRYADGRSMLSAIRDDIEAIAFALVMALLLRHFCIEVFKIPTGSMYPTLYGDNPSANPPIVGDRILLDKMAYLFGGPDRFDIVVFRYPLDKSRNFIKRVAFLPSEEGRIERGDLWVRPNGSSGEFAVPRKPRRAREQMYFPVYPPAAPGERARTGFYWRDAADGGTPVQIASADEFVFPGGPAGVPETDPRGHGALNYGLLITDTTHARDAPTSSSGRPVYDVRVRLDAEPASDRCACEISWRPGDGRTARLRLATEGLPPSAARTASKESTLSARIARGRRTAVELESVDGDFRAWVDGDEVAVIADDLTLGDIEKMQEESAKESQHLQLRAEGGAITLRNVRVDRDLYYLSNRDDPDVVPRRGESMAMPDDGYFMLGDNTGSSSDGRKWRARGTRMKDGGAVWYDSGTSPHSFTEGGRERRTVVDVDGINRTWDAADEDPASPFLDRRISIVTRDLIVGRAFFAMVFWPLTADSLQRFRFVH